MPIFLAILTLALTVKEDRTPLRNGCATDSDVVATLPAGAQVTIQFALAGEATPCYKIATQADGHAIEGYLTADAIQGLDEFDRGRREAEWLDPAQVMAAIRSSFGLPSLKPSPTKPIATTPQGLVDQAAELIQASQPAKALALLDPELKKRKDPVLLAVAGVAAWRSDDSGRALELWRGSLDMHPNPDLESLYRRVERENKNDQGIDKIYGARVLLRYDSATVPAETARQMTGALDQEYARISGQLGCYAEERIVAIVQSQAAYRKTTDAAEWSGGQYDGRIRVPVVGGQGMDASMRRVLAHETTHACLTMLGRWPAWLQEGMAQKLSGDTITTALRQKISNMKMPRLENLKQDWSRLDTDHAVAAYGLSLAAVELLYQNYGSDGVGNLLRNPDRLASMTADLDKKLGL